jgi:D-alanyl-D-alanine carboxypeptidase
MQFMKIFIKLIILVISMATLPVTAGQCGFDETMNSLLADFIDANNIPGAVISIKLPDHETCTYSAGYADLSAKKQMTNDTLFSVGSITKSFTTISLQQLESTGQVKYSDPLNKFAANNPVLKDILKKYPKLKDITLQELVNHTSGIADVFRTAAYAQAFLQNPEFHADAGSLIKMAMGQPSGTRGEFHFSNTNYLLTGLVIEAVTGKPLAVTEANLLSVAQIRQAYLPDALKANFTDKINSALAHGYLSHNSRWSPSFTRLIKRYPKIYIEGNQEAETAYDVTSIDLAQLMEGSAAGEMLMTVPDMVKWYQYLFANELNLSAANTALPVAHGSAPFAGAGMGINMNYLPRYGLTVYTHNGSVYGFNTNLIYIKNNNIIIALAINAQHSKTQLNQELAVSILDYLKKAGYFMQETRHEIHHPHPGQPDNLLV